MHNLADVDIWLGGVHGAPDYLALREVCLAKVRTGYFRHLADVPLYFVTRRPLSLVTRLR